MWKLTHLGYNCIKRQCAVAAEKLNDDPAGTYKEMDARVRMKNMLMYMHSCHLNSCEMYWREAMRITRGRAWAQGNRCCP